MTTHDEPLEQTPAGIPLSLRPFFQEYVLEDLDPERSAATVIERTLAWGDLPELSWLFAQYGHERLAEWVRQAGWRFLPWRRLKYWLSFFGLSEVQRGERIWPHYLRRTGRR
jgi:hypothetical protein